MSVGFIGAGNVLWAYLQALDRLIPTAAAVLGGIYVRNPKTRTELAARRPHAILFDRLNLFLAADIDVVVVITPPQSHADLARLALSNGKHVLVEKPLAETTASARSLVRLARRLRRLLVAAPFVHQSPTFAFLRNALSRGDIGPIHSARALYGNLGSDWARWYHASHLGPLAEIGIYNLKSLTSILDPVRSVIQCEGRSGMQRHVAGRRLLRTDADVAQTVLTHKSGAISSILTSHAIPQYRRAALEFYGTAGTANLNGDDWDPRGVDIYQSDSRCWQSHSAIEPTWLWSDGLSDLVMALRANRAPNSDLDQDVHLIEVIAAAAQSVRAHRPVSVRSAWSGLKAATSPTTLQGTAHRHIHDHTRPADQQ